MAWEYRKDGTPPRTRMEQKSREKFPHDLYELIAVFSEPPRNSLNPAKDWVDTHDPQDLSIKKSDFPKIDDRGCQMKRPK